MRKISRPSPAMVVAGTALVAAVAGTAIATPLAVKSVLNKQEKKQARNIARGEIATAAPGLSVANAQNAQSAANAQNAANAQSAANATNATNATNAATAANANALGGIAAGQFGQVLVGRADSSDGVVSTVFSVPSLGVAIQDNGGFVDGSAFKVTNTRQVGGGNVVVDFAGNDDANGSQPVAPGNSSSFVPKTGNPAFVTDPAALGRVLVVWCQLGVSSKITCLGLLKD